MNHLCLGITYVLLAPVIGGLLDGMDRIITSRMQRRVGPPLLQPFYDIFKLFQKETVIVNQLQNPAIFAHLILMIVTGFLFFEGTDILLIIFVLTFSSVLLILAAYASNSPFSCIGAERELILMMAYEPIILIALVGIYKITGSFHFYTIITSGKPLILYLPGIFIAFLFIINIKFRKSPFDISYSHHAHQELVKGITSDFSGRSIAMVEIALWYEEVFLLGFVYLFFSFNIFAGIGSIFLTYFSMILIDNTFARFKWGLAFRSSWKVAFYLGGGNLIALYAFTGV